MKLNLTTELAAQIARDEKDKPDRTNGLCMLAMSLKNNIVVDKELGIIAVKQTIYSSEMLVH